MGGSFSSTPGGRRRGLGGALPAGRSEQTCWIGDEDSITKILRRALGVGGRRRGIVGSMPECIGMHWMDMHRMGRMVYSGLSALPFYSGFNANHQ